MATLSIDYDLHGPSIDAVLGVEDMASLVFVLLMLKSQNLGDNKSGARIFVTKDLIIFIFVHLPVHGHLLRGFHFFFTHGVDVPSSLKIMVRLLVHSKDLWPRPPHVKHLKELVLMVSSVGVDDDEALGLKLLVVGGRLEVAVVFL